MEFLVTLVAISTLVFVPIGLVIYWGNRRWLVEGREGDRRATRAAVVVLSVIEQGAVNLLGFALVYYSYWPEMGPEVQFAQGIWTLLVLLIGVPLALVSTAVNIVLLSVLIAGMEKAKEVRAAA